ncbi:MAG TPA: RNA-binding protein [Burkholderiales bacterium]|nr:RNA-binding protein [Burkholderiales bacterium]
MKLWIGNLDPATTDEELRQFLAKYSKLEIVSLVRVPGDGSRPGAVLEFGSANSLAVYEAQRRLHGMYWNKRELNVQVMRE